MLHRTAYGNKIVIYIVIVFFYLLEIIVFHTKNTVAARLLNLCFRFHSNLRRTTRSSTKEKNANKTEKPRNNDWRQLRVLMDSIGEHCVSFENHSHIMQPAIAYFKWVKCLKRQFLLSIIQFKYLIEVERKQIDWKMTCFRRVNQIQEQKKNKCYLQITETAAALTTTTNMKWVTKKHFESWNERLDFISHKY